jgi:dihydroorotase
MDRMAVVGGTVMDPETGRETSRDLLLEDGRLTDRIPDGSEQRVDAAGCRVCPGFIDLHTHVFNHPLFGKGRVPADRIGVGQGVAAVVDAGSSGAATIDAFPEVVLNTQATRVFSFINIGSPGLPNLGGGHASRPELCDLEGVVRAFDRYGDWLVGVKVLASSSHTGSFGLEAVKMARKAAELVGRPLMLHVGNAPPLIDDVLSLLREGDIVTHTYHGKVGGVLGYRDRIIPAFADAVRRGVIVDLGHGRSSFSFRVCELALEQGMPLHTISSDLHRGNLERYAVSLARTMTKMRVLGLSLGEVVHKVTLAPARAIGVDALGLGRLAPGLPANLTIFREREGPLTLEDAEGATRCAERFIEPVGVVLGERYFPVCEPF